MSSTSRRRRREELHLVGRVSVLVALAVACDEQPETPTRPPERGTAAPAVEQPPPTEVENAPATAAPATVAAAHQETDVDGDGFPERKGPAIKVGTWNIQTFGKTKASRPATMKVIVDVVRSFDVVAIQEIKDVTGKTPQKLLSQINQTSPRFAMLLSPRTGKQADDQGAGQEQYAYYYNVDTVERVGQAFLYDDAAHDHFQREPWIARFKAKGGTFSFVLIDIHTKPDAAVSEIDALAQVVTWARGKYEDEDDFISLGDYNASCSYASTKELDALTLRGGEYFWIVPDSADTTVKSTTCAYDRIVPSIATKEDYAGHWAIVTAGIDATVSDHFAVIANFLKNGDTNKVGAPPQLRLGDVGESDKPQPSPPAPMSTTSGACCKICKSGRACGDSCISASKTCRKPPGCACDG